MQQKKHRNTEKCDKEKKAKIKVFSERQYRSGKNTCGNAICQKTQAITFLRMSARVDTVAARVQTAVTMGKGTKSMAGVLKSMDAALRSMNSEKTSALMTDLNPNLKHQMFKYNKWKTQRVGLQS